MANNALSKILKILSKDAEHSKYGSFMGMLGLGSSKFSSRYRLAAHALHCFLSLRRHFVIVKGKKLKKDDIRFDWEGNEPLNTNEHGKIEEKERDRFLSEFQSLSKSKTYKDFKIQIDRLLFYITSSELRVKNSDRFLNHIIAVLFPSKNWPQEWLFDDEISSPLPLSPPFPLPSSSSPALSPSPDASHPSGYVSVDDGKESEEGRGVNMYQAYEPPPPPYQHP